MLPRAGLSIGRLTEEFTGPLVVSLSKGLYRARGCGRSAGYCCRNGSGFRFGLFAEFGQSAMAGSIEFVYRRANRPLRFGKESRGLYPLGAEGEKELDFAGFDTTRHKIMALRPSHLYRLRVVLTQHDQDFHALETTFGVRSIEIKDAGFYLNGMRVWLAGVERMAGATQNSHG